MHSRQESGWTMDRFIEWAFGPERVFEVIARVEEAQRVTERLIETPGDAGLRRTLHVDLRGLRDTADANRWVHEGDVAAAIVRLPVSSGDARATMLRVRAWLRSLERLVRGRLAHSIALTRRAA